MTKRPQFFAQIIATASDMPRWLSDDERGLLEEAVCYAQRENMVVLANLASDVFTYLVLAQKVAETFEVALRDAFAIGRACKIVEQTRAVKEAIYSLRLPGCDEVITAIDLQIDLPEVLRLAGE